MGDTEASAFSYTSELSDPATVWEGRLLGLVETDTSQWNDATGRCFVLLGVMTPTAGPPTEDANPSYLFLSADLGEDTVFDRPNDCDTEAILAKGYGPKLNGQVPIGTTWPFFTEFFVPGDSTAPIDSVTVGIKPNEAGNGSAQYFEPTILTDIPAPPA